MLKVRDFVVRSNTANGRKRAEVDAPEAAIVTARKPAGAAVGAPPRKFNPRHFDLPSTRGLGVETAKFQGTGHIEGSENWNGEKYATFRNYHHEWHDGEWWRHHHNRVVLIFGGWYYWHRGYWYPAWGYISMRLMRMTARFMPITICHLTKLSPTFRLHYESSVTITASIRLTPLLASIVCLLGNVFLRR